MKKINVDMICAKKRITNGYKMKRKDETQWIVAEENGLSLIKLFWSDDSADIYPCDEYHQYY